MGVGADAALYLLGQIGYEGPILTQRFESNVGTRIRGKVLDIVLSENTGVEVVGSHSMARTKSWRDDVRNGMQALILQNAGNFKGIWASFDGQAFIIDDILAAQGMAKGDVALVSIDGGAEAYRRIKDPASMMTATVAIPFEVMGKAAVDAMERIAVGGEAREAITAGPYLFMNAVLVDLLQRRPVPRLSVCGVRRRLPPRLRSRRGTVATILSVEGAMKTFGAVEALRGADLGVTRGEIHAICGDNGAGKSTLIKLISGVEQPDAGTIRLRGEAIAFTSPQQALEAGIATIYQDLGLAPRMTIYENIFMGSELERRLLGLKCLDKRAMRNESRAYLDRLGIGLTNMDTPVEELSGGQRQAVAICRALRWNADVIIMDEPTAALGVRETEHVLDLIRMLKQRGATVIVVSHNMNHVAAIADRATILRSGRTQADVSLDGVTPDALSRLILSGRAA